MRDFFPLLMSLAVVCSLTVSAPAAPFPDEDGAAIKRATVQASPSIVRIETIGGLDVVDGELAGTGPTTGVIVSEDGYILTSAFNFAANPSSILVTLPESDQRRAAEVIARDHLKQLTLLKVDATGLTPATAAPLEDIRIGQWALALGRTYDASLPNVSLGLVSALGRVSGKAIQTDAKVSPANYGGPLIDLDGRVLGVLVPLSPQGKGVTDGVNWYDSGIGFAIPLVEIEPRLEQLKKGEDLHPGLMGVSFNATPAFMTDPVIQEVRPGSPAAEAELVKGDRITAINGIEVSSVAGMQQVLGQLYAGDTLEMTVSRNDETVNTSFTLAAELQTFHFGWAGLLPRLTSDEEAENEQAGVELRYIYPGSPAETAELTTDDVITAVDGEELQTVQQLRQQMEMKQPEETAELTVVRNGESRKVSVTLADVPQEIPAEIPQPLLTAGAAGIETGEIELQVPEQKQQYKLYVPDDYRAGDSYGCLVWLPTVGGTVPADQYGEWKRLCRSRGFVLLMPQPTELRPWSPDDTTGILASLEDATTRYQLDEQRTCIITGGQDPSYAWRFAFEHREMFDGLISYSVPRQFDPPYSEPGKRFLLKLELPADFKDELVPQIQERLNTEGFPAVVSKRKEESTADDWDALGRWLELLGSL